MVSLREVENLKNIIQEQKQEIEQLKQQISKISFVSNDNNDLSIIFVKYKKSLLVKNMYDNKNTTTKCKVLMKELGAKWFKNNAMQGWLFVGIFKDNEKSIEETCKFLVDKLEENNFNLNLIYENN